jgi:hypothetical protein
MSDRWSRVSGLLTLAWMIPLGVRTLAARA